MIELKDIVKHGIRERFAELRRMGIKTVMITGDNPLTAAAIAAEAGVDMIPCRIIYKGGKMRVFGRCTVVFGKPIPAEKLKLGEPRSAARLRECKALLAEELEKLLEENRQYL